MKVWKNASIIPILHEIMLTNTIHYQTDFEIDKKILRNAAKSRHFDDKKLLWMSRPSGTHCLREREVFIKGTSAHNTWTYYGEHSNDPILAYFVEVRYRDRSGIYGNVYELRYAEHVKAVQEYSVDPKSEIMIFEDGFEVELPFGFRKPDTDTLCAEHGEIVYSRAIPVSEDDLSRVVALQESLRERLLYLLREKNIKTTR